MQVANVRPKGCEPFPMSSFMSMMSPASRLVLSVHRRKWEESTSLGGSAARAQFQCWICHFRALVVENPER